MMYVVLFLVLLVAGGSFSVSDSLFNMESLVFKSSMTFLNTSLDVHHMEVDMYRSDGSIIFTDGTSLKTVSKDQRTSTVASGFRHVTGFRQINSTHLAVTDYHCLKMINREDGSVKLLAGQFHRSGYSDGSPGLFYLPWSVEIDVRTPGNLLITDYNNNALRSVNINTGAVSTVIRSGFSGPSGMTWHKDRLLVVNEHYISEVVWTGENTVTNTILAGFNSWGDVDGSFSLSRVIYPHDIHPISEYLYLVADISNHKLCLLDISKQQVLPVCTNNILLCNKSTTIYYPYSVLKTDDAVYVGQLGKITKLTGATLHTPITTPTQTCEDRNISVTLSDGETKTVVEVSAGKWLTLEAGAYKYTDSWNGSCTVSVNVASNFTCPASITVIASNSAGVASIDWPVKESENKLLLPIGRFSYRVPYIGKICDVTINVIDPHLRRRLVFQADYDLPCEPEIHDISKQAVANMAKQHFNQIQEICGNHCQPTNKCVFTCNMGKFGVQWPTDLVYNGDIQELEPEARSAFHKYISGQSTSFLSLVVLKNYLELVKPVRDSDGNSVTFTLSSYCLGNYTYNSEMDRCLSHC